MKNKDYSKYLTMTPKELRKLQNTKGILLSIVGYLVYGIFRIIGEKPKSFYGVCPYFEIGQGWGGVSFGWFFVCSKKMSESGKCHEWGHCIQNAAVGGISMVTYSIRSAIRYWKLTLTKSNEEYDSWFFEGDATRIGTAYIENLKKGSAEDGD